MPKMRTYYDREFKLKVVELGHKREDSVAELAKELGLSVKLLYRWRNCDFLKLLLLLFSDQLNFAIL